MDFAKSGRYWNKWPSHSGLQIIGASDQVPDCFCFQEVSCDLFLIKILLFYFVYIRQNLEVKNG